MSFGLTLPSPARAAQPSDRMRVAGPQEISH